MKVATPIVKPASKSSPLGFAVQSAPVAVEKPVEKPVVKKEAPVKAKPVEKVAAPVEKAAAPALRKRDEKAQSKVVVKEEKK